MFNIQEELKKLPRKPGVYIMKDFLGNIIYIGKAKNLYNRVHQYFQNSKSLTPKTRSMVPKISEFEYIVTDTEMEALILECNLIKEYRPKYNISLKDDKTYPYIKITVLEEFPRIFMTRSYVRDKNKYYGPFADAGAVHSLLDVIHRTWPVRECNKSLPKDSGKERPCLNHFIGRCAAPCAYGITSKAYGEMIDQITEVLSGRPDAVINRLTQEMKELSANMEFERAAALRDKIDDILKISEKQKMSGTGDDDRDIIAIAKGEKKALALVFLMRGGKLIGKESFFLSSKEETDESELISEFVKQHYNNVAFIPPNILLQYPIYEKELLESFLSELRGSKVSLVVPKKGEKHKLMELAKQNAFLALTQAEDRARREEKRTQDAQRDICLALGFEEDALKRIESYDISNTSGIESVGSMVVFEDGKPKKKDYRKFKIKTVLGSNDAASMLEVISRRLKHLNDGEGSFNALPDIIMVDGGKTQIKAAEEAILNAGLNIPVCGMVKDDKHRTRGLIYKGEEIAFSKTSEAFKLITRIQDETHRFAIEYHRSLRDKAMLKSMLDEIPGIGPVRQKALIKSFGDIYAIKNAQVSDLLEVPGMTIPAAEAVYSFFRQTNGNG